MHSVKIALSVALALAVVTIGVTLSRSPLVVAGKNSVPGEADVELNNGNASTSSCQQAGTLPRGISAIRVALEVRAVGPRVVLKVLSGSRVLTAGEVPAGWGVATSATVPVRRVSHTVRNALICMTIGPTVEPFRVRGALVDPTATEVRTVREVRLGMEYLRPGRRSWSSLGSSIAHHMGLGNAAGGGWVVFPTIALMLAVAILASRLALRELAVNSRATRWRATEPTTSSLPLRARETLRRIPRAAWICAVIACLNAAGWSLITPPLQIPDEQSHFAYTQQLAENQRLPISGESTFSPEEQAVLLDLHHQEVRGSPETHTISSAGQRRLLENTLGQHLSRHPVGVGGAATYPPLYYLLETVPYGLASPGTLLDQLELMRLFSALMAGLTALFAFLFVRETLPGVRWAWTVGGLGVAVAPLLGFMSGAVNPDSMLFAVSAMVFYCLARAFRRGLTRGLALAIGALLAVGFLTKPNFIGLVPGVILGLIVLAVGVSRTQGQRAAVVSLGLAFAIASGPLCIYVLANLLSNRPGLGVISTTLQSGIRQGSVLGRLSYIWQLYLPRLPGTTNYFPGLFTARQLWFDRSVGFYGWLDTTFPPWVDTLALIPAGLIVLLCIRSLAAAGALLRGRLAELIVYLTMGVGLMALVGASSYLKMSSEGLSFAEPRYLAPMLPVLAAVLALAARGAGRRWGPTAGALIIVLFLAHDIFSQLLLVGRYYG